MSNIRYPAARLQRVMHAAPQFRPIRRGDRRHEILRSHECRNGDRVNIAIFDELDIADQDVFLCFLAMARAKNRGIVITNEPKSADTQALRGALKLNWYAATQDVVVIRSTLYEILVEVGRATDQRSYQWLKKSIIRLSCVSFVYEGEQRWAFNLLSVSGIDAGDNEELSICINPLSTRAIIGDAGGYTLVHRGERMQLETAEAKALHCVLCGLVDMGAERVLRVDMLANKVYSRYDEEINSAVIRRRRKNIIDAGIQLAGLGYWSCSTIGKGSSSVLSIKRKRRSDES